MISGAVLILAEGACDGGDDNITPVNPNNPGSTTSDCSTNAATFADANAIIQSSCSRSSSCHGNGSQSGPGALTSYGQIFNARTSIRSAVKSGAMPRGITLSAAQKNTIICWIENGAANN